MKEIKMKWGVDFPEFGVALLFPTKAKAQKVMKEFLKLYPTTVSKLDIIKFAHTNHITLSYHVVNLNGKIEGNV